MDKCTAKSKQTGERCKRYPTPGRRVCYYHGGKAGRPLIHGRYSKALELLPAIQERYEVHKKDPAFKETLNEIALNRALLDYYLSTREESEMSHPVTTEEVRTFSDIISRLLERRHKMEHGEQITITMATLETFAARVMDLVKSEYGDDDRYTALVKRLRDEHLAPSA